MNTEARKRLHDIRLAAEALARFTDGKTVEVLKADEILQAAVERKLEIIGEAFVQLRAEDPATAEHFPELRQIVGMRNRLCMVTTSLIWMSCGTQRSARFPNC